MSRTAPARLANAVSRNILRLSGRVMRRFATSRRGTIAITFAICLVPLLMLIGLAIDYSFLSESRTQTVFASQAAALSATRVAAATYALEVNNGSTPAAAAQRAIVAANSAGNLWFNADLGIINGASLQGVATNTTYDGGTTGTVNTSAPPNFSSTVSDSASYQPTFNPLFSATKPWTYGSGATATTQFSYAQILLMLDTSGSMLIGADTADIQTIEQNSMCPANSNLIVTAGMTVVPPAQTVGHAVSITSVADGGYEFQSADNDAINFSTVPKFILPSNGSYTSGSCAPGYGSQTFIDGANGNQTAGTPCALACHTSSARAPDGFYADQYGEARRENAKLRIDILFQATENVIQDMQTSEAVANQLSVGVYSFTTDTYPIATGTTSDALPEATSNLSQALANVEAVDYTKTPSETVIPELINLPLAGYAGTNYVYAANPSGPANQDNIVGGGTDFPESMNELVAGAAQPSGTGGALRPLTASGSGNTVATPLKFMFIVTDGMNDIGAPDYTAKYYTGATARLTGDMTGISAETAKTGSCSALKTLGYTVYVLYVSYFPLASYQYYVDGIIGLNAVTQVDFPSLASSASVQTLTEVAAPGASSATITTSTGTVIPNSPTVLALQACASSKQDFYAASSSGDIQSALNQMLKAALASTIRLTN